MDEMVINVRTMIQHVDEATTLVGEEATKMSKTSRDTNQGALSQREATEHVAAAMQEMSATAQEVSRNVTSASESASQAEEESLNGRQVVMETIEGIYSLAQEVERAGTAMESLANLTVSINSILDVINDIAAQTNLLALNAAIEAARAGEQGRGFAVVTDEVRTLATRTERSTREIQEVIESLQKGQAMPLR